MPSIRLKRVAISSGSKKIVLTLFRLPKFLISKCFKESLDILAKRGYFLQHPVYHDTNILYKNPQWLKFNKTEGTPFIVGGNRYCRKVPNDPRYHSDSSRENERAVFPKS
ncbi:hypothetical protein BDV33DRAFT_192422 [Aspergillus novoparasiticus]|uniref:Uncharacterized protein n=1 Tax=Aspergillus novoparasiticus TaxID=986946 RepID=A0A5N6ENY3_9EURO|nr:hypothetical protein BDV33DRAFT_192422 [Aspergillus novoparasiticus]